MAVLPGKKSYSWFSNVLSFPVTFIQKKQFLWKCLSYCSKFLNYSWVNIFCFGRILNGNNYKLNTKLEKHFVHSILQFLIYKKEIERKKVEDHPWEAILVKHQCSGAFDAGITIASGKCSFHCPCQTFVYRPGGWGHAVIWIAAQCKSF